MKKSLIEAMHAAKKAHMFFLEQCIDPENRENKTMLFVFLHGLKKELLQNTKSTHFLFLRIQTKKTKNIKESKKNIFGPQTKTSAKIVFFCS